jgi:dGTPase
MNWCGSLPSPLADDIAYGVHDFEDGVWAGMVPLFELITANPRIVALLESRVAELDAERMFAAEQLFSDGDCSRVLVELFDSPDLDYLRQGPFDRTHEARSILKDMTAGVIGELIDAATEGGSFQPLTGDEARKLGVLKAMAWQWMIDRTDIATIQFGQRRMIQRIFEGYWRQPAMLPRRDEWLKVKGESAEEDGRWPEKVRLIRDHIAGMTDGYARDVYDQMYRGTQRRDLRLAY